MGFLRDLAFQHGWIYGIVAVIVALLAGFGVGALMPSKDGSH
ncbi:MAG: TIGR02186 family protein [Thermodesulfobacteriota bacterium]